jgi:hypothetical protein
MKIPNLLQKMFCKKGFDLGYQQPLLEQKAWAKIWEMCQTLPLMAM